ncbi:hypothetical protein PMG11_11096 [Penicillium brasilianum]|uniref:Uncharacterized protein n=1 Tax=Penicillium brasilianum TaxID=104259 RepID=A0A0F7U0Y9_PENBI|nr:hypothetical protein PMG11_11096 [Penicillium brasilianum]
MEKFELDRQSFQPVLEDHSGGLSIIVPDRNLADRPAEREDRRALGFIQYGKGLVESPSQMLACDSPSMLLVWDSQLQTPMTVLWDVTGRVSSWRRWFSLKMAFRLHFDFLYCGDIPENQVDPV